MFNFAGLKGTLGIGFQSLSLLGGSRSYYKGLLWLPKQRKKGQVLKSILKRKYWRKRRGKTNERPRKPDYGFEDGILPRTNI